MLGDMIDGLTQLDAFMHQHETFLQAYDQLIRAVSHLPTNADSHDHVYVEGEEKRRRGIEESVSATASEALARIQDSHAKKSPA
jgi:hypothetical protein